MPTALHPTTFHRHNRPLRTLLLESEVWFCARDLGRLMGWPLNERTTRKLDADQRRVVTLVNGQGEEEALVVSESAVYALLTYHYHGENRACSAGLPMRWCRVCGMRRCRRRPVIPA